MVLIAAVNQSEEDLLDDPACRRIGTAVICDDKKKAPVVFVGYAAWRPPANDGANHSDTQVWRIRNNEVALLEPRNDLVALSADRLAWGNSGDGAAQLSIAILMEVLNSWPRVQKIYPQFMDRFVSRLPQGRNWMAEGAIVLRIVHGIETVPRVSVFGS